MIILVINSQAYLDSTTTKKKIKTHDERITLTF
jgi:hypothetical protein